MHEPWFYCPALHTGEIVLDKTEARHALRSMRLQPGDALTLFDGAGQIARATLLSNHDRRAQPAAIVHVKSLTSLPPPASALTLIVAACKGARLDWLAEKATELGVTGLTLTEFEHSVVHIGPQHIERLQRTAIEACKQCQRARLPRFELAPSLAGAIACHSTIPLLIAHPAPEAPMFANWLAQRRDTLRELAIVIGPEGGFSTTELATATSAGVQLVRLATHVLRVETAALAAAAQWAGVDLGVQA
jgi:16S rRNA (uracil1498-N3)-methyltransferase